MLDSIYIGLTGLSGYSKGLSNISNNVANLNTPGFKGSQLVFSDLFYQYQTAGQGDGNSYSQGSGLNAGNSSVIFRQGELRATGNDQDIAVDGNGMFVLRKDGETFYTRAGQFSFDDDGYLISRSAEARVAALVGADGLKDINVSGLRSNPPRATATVRFSDTLSSNDTTFNISTVNIIDRLGGTNTLNLRLEKTATPTIWTLQVKNGDNVISTGEIRYTNSLPQPGFDSHTFSFASPTGGNQLIRLDFSGTNLLSAASSTVKVSTQDGLAAGSLTKASFDEDGFLVMTYSNGQTVKREQLALAWFNNLQQLEQVGGNLFRNTGEQETLLGNAGESVFGTLKGGSVEASNIDLAQQFSELITTQRGYQASSQIISAANEMLQQLFDIRGKR